MLDLTATGIQARSPTKRQIFQQSIQSTSANAKGKNPLENLTRVQGLPENQKEHYYRLYPNP